MPPEKKPFNHCPLCASAQINPFAQDKKRNYQRCTSCALVFADPATWPSLSDEKSVYDLHENHIDDAGYNRFLQRIVEPLIERIPTQSRILDFGCGPAPALANQITNLGHQVNLYDVFYFPEPSVLCELYDAIVLTEVIEHLHTPLATLQSLWEQLHPNGVLGIMTQRVIDADKFMSWQYKNDPTHVCFYAQETFTWLAQDLRATRCEFVGRDMVFLHKR